MKGSGAPYVCIYIYICIWGYEGEKGNTKIVKILSV
jgi:hypothetical protein